MKVWDYYPVVMKLLEKMENGNLRGTPQVTDTKKPTPKEGSTADMGYHELARRLGDSVNSRRK